MKPQVTTLAIVLAMCLVGARAEGMAGSGRTDVERHSTEAVGTVEAEAQALEIARRAEALGEQLTPSQRAALVQALERWRAMGDDQVPTLASEIDRDLEYILPPTQKAELMGLLRPALLEIAEYQPRACSSSTGMGFLTSLITQIVCPSDYADVGTYAAYVAFTYAGVCVREGVTECPDAADYAIWGATLWYAASSECGYSAKVPALVLLEAYYVCGG